jgi:hypothetical protein
VALNTAWTDQLQKDFAIRTVRVYSVPFPLLVFIRSPFAAIDSIQASTQLTRVSPPVDQRESLNKRPWYPLCTIVRAVTSCPCVNCPNLTRVVLCTRVS